MTTPLPNVDGSSFMEPLRGAHLNLRSRLEARLAWRSRENPFWEALFAFLLSSRHTFHAGIVLVSNDRLEDLGTIFPAQATILARSLLECLANVMALCAYPDRIGELGRDGYKEGRKALAHVASASWGSTPRWQTWRTNQQSMLDAQARTLQLTSAEIANYGKLRSWPQMHGLLTARDGQARQYVDGTAKDALQELYDFWYPEQSRLAHQKDLAIIEAMRSFRMKGADVSTWEEYRNTATISLCLFHACILSEIEAVGMWPNGPRRELADAWTNLSAIADHAKDIHSRRYQALLVP